jgi:hypothetical protein
MTPLSQLSYYTTACETIGEDACLADIYLEVRLQPEVTNNTARIASEINVDREYVEYTDAKTYVVLISQHQISCQLQIAKTILVYTKIMY